MTLVEEYEIGAAKVCCATGLGMLHDGWHDDVYRETGTVVGEQRTERTLRFDVFLLLRPTFVD